MVRDAIIYASLAQQQQTARSLPRYIYLLMARRHGRQRNDRRLQFSRQVAGAANYAIDQRYRRRGAATHGRREMILMRQEMHAGRLYITTVI